MHLRTTPHLFSLFYVPFASSNGNYNKKQETKDISNILNGLKMMDFVEDIWLLVTFQF